MKTECYKVMDEIKNTEQTVPPQAAAQAGQEPAKPRMRKTLARVMGGGVMQSKGMRRQIPLILLICLFGICLVYARYRVEDLCKRKQAKQEEINSLRQRSIDLQKRYQETVKISQIARMLDSTGIGITAGPPYELKIES